jgi:hypothetical protein
MRSAISPRFAMRTLVKMVYVLSSVDFEEHRSIFDGLAVATFDCHDPTRAAASHGITDAKCLDKSELTVALEQIAFGRRRAAQMEDPHQVGADLVGSDRVRLDCPQIVRHVRNQIRMQGPPTEFDLFALALDPEPQEIGSREELGEGSDAPGDRGGWVLVGHRR